MFSLKWIETFFYEKSFICIYLFVFTRDILYVLHTIGWEWAQNHFFQCYFPYQWIRTIYEHASTILSRYVLKILLIFFKVRYFCWEMMYLPVYLFFRRRMLIWKSSSLRIYLLVFLCMFLPYFLFCSTAFSQTSALVPWHARMMNWEYICRMEVEISKHFKNCMILLNFVIIECFQSYEIKIICLLLLL